MRILADSGATCQRGLTYTLIDGGRWAVRLCSLAQTSRLRLRLQWERVTLLLRFTRRHQLSVPRSATPARLQRGPLRKKNADHIIITLVLLSSRTSEQLALNSAPEDTYETG